MNNVLPESIKDYNEYIIWDIRDEMAYAYGHLPNAISVPIDTIEDRLCEIETDKKYLVYCKRGEKSVEVVQRFLDRNMDA